MKQIKRDLPLILRTEAGNQWKPPIDYVIAEDGGRMVHCPEPDAAMAELLEEAAAEIESLRARLAEKDNALEPFAGVAELVDLETEGFSNDDTFELMFNDFLLDRFTLADFRRTREAWGGEDA